MAKLKPSVALKARFGNYKSGGRFYKNKLKKLQRHLKKYPNDEQAKGAMVHIKEYSRKAPNTKQEQFRVVFKKTKSGKEIYRKERIQPLKVDVFKFENGIPSITPENGLPKSIGEQLKELGVKGRF